jgi:nucleoside-diphosphate-sugar epimerase
MPLHLVVGAGPIGSGVAQLLADSGEQVRIVTRRGSGPEHPAVERVAADASDAARLRELARDTAAIYNCANPPYHRWTTDWPPIAAALLDAAEASGAVLAITGNLYGYGPVDAPMTEDLPLAATTRKGRVRARIWLDALAAHQAGRVRVTEARGSDYVGPGAQSLFSYAAPAVLAGKTARLPANLDVPHSMTYTVDMARTLVTVARDERAWGRPWHVPTAPARTIRDMLVDFSRLAGAPEPKLAVLPHPLMRAIGVFSTQLRELDEMRYQFVRPFILDSSRATRELGLTATPLEESLATTAHAMRPAVA